MNVTGARRPAATLLLIGALALLYAGTGLLGLQLAAPPGNVTAAWLPAGLGVAALLRLGPRLWPGITLGSFACNLLVFPAPTLGARAWGSALIALSSTAGLTLVARLGERSAARHPPASPRVLVAWAGWAVVGCTINALGGLASTAAFSGAPLEFWRTFLTTWLLGDTLGIFIVLPLVLSEGEAGPPRPLEWAGSLALTLAVCQLTFGMPLPGLGASTLPLTWTLSLGMIWAGARLGGPAVSVHTLLLYALMSWGTLRGLGPFAGEPRARAMLLIDAVLLVMLGIGLLLSRLAALGRVQTALLEQERANLEARVEERSRALLAETAARARLTQRLVEVEKQEALGRLAGGVAHDFNNLLTVVSGEAELLRRTGNSPDVHDGAGAILAAAHRAGELTRQLLAVARRQPTQPRQVDLQAALVTNRRLLRPLFPESVALNVDCESACGVKIDPTQLDQLILNLALNARDATAGKGSVRIAARRETLEGPRAAGLGLTPGDWVCLSVTDDGGGIAPENLPHIFEPFFTTKQESRGTGLGLSTVWGIAEQSRGAVKVSSAPGQTIFSVWLPASDAPEEPPGQLAPGQGAGGRRGTILVVEDEPLVRRTVVLALERAGHRTLTASDGEEALEVLRRSAPEVDLVLTDVVMPRRGGVELARAVRESTRLPVLFMSGFHERQAELAHERVLNKPFTTEQLLAAVAATLAGSAAA